jgi:Flp pilus assembly protein TadG
MLAKSLLPPRRGTIAVECAVVYPLTFLILLGLVVGGLGVFRYQQVAALAREGARWASVRGALYQQETGQPAATAASVYNAVLLPNAAGLDPSRLSHTVMWNTDNWPSHLTSSNGTVVGNTVTVTVTYQWLPEAYLLGPITLRSTSVMPMAY